MAEKSFGVKEINLIGASGTPTIESPNNLNLNAVNVAISTNVSIGGTLTVTGNVSIGGTLTYEEVTNIDSVGFITARDGVLVGKGVSITSGGLNISSGISTFSDTVRIGGDMSFPLRVTTNSTTAIRSVNHTSSRYVDLSPDYYRSGSNTGDAGIFVSSGRGFRFYYDGDVQFRKDSDDTVKLTINKLGDINAGVITATSFVGDGSGITGISGGGSGISTISNFVNIVDSLDVDGHTNLDNVSIAGITTFSDSIYAGRIYLGGSNGKYMQAGTNFELNMSGGVDMIFSVNTGGGTSGDIRLRRGSGTDSLVVNGSGGVTVTGTLSATTFSGSGANLTNLPSSQLSGSLPSISGANLTNLPSPDPSDTDVQVTFDIAGNSSSGYTFTGPGNDGSTGNPDIYLIRGQRYRFNNTTGTNHPFEFRNADNNADYTDGITGSQSGIQDFNVQYDAPAQLKYRCTIHTGTMVGNIYIVGSFPKISVSGQSDVVADNLADTLNLAAGSNVSITTNASTDTITISATDTNTDTNYYANSLSFSTSTGVLTLGRSGLSNLTVDLDGRYLDSSSSLSATNLTGTINNSRLPTAIDIGTSGTIKAKEFQSSGQTNRLTQAGFSVHHATGFEGLSLVKSGSGWGTAIFVNRLASSGTGNIMEIQYNGSAVGGISITTSATSFNTGSDYRLKQDITPITNALTKIKTLNPVDFKWKNNTSKFVTGFIAHEVQETGHFDETVTGVKDGMRSKYDDPETQEEDYQTVDYSKFTPMVVAALKEISDKVDALDTRLTSLENT
jgi:hypothetical protein